MRIALGLEYSGASFTGWQSQADGRGVQDVLERALGVIADARIRTVAAGRTDAGVHATMQVVHFDTDAARPQNAWIRGVNSHLPADIAVQWAEPVAAEFHARYMARARHYTYLLLLRATRPALVASRVGWYHRPLDVGAMREAAAELSGTHDFSAFRAAECQAASPVRTLSAIDVDADGEYIRFDFSANAFLHHMIRNIVGSLVAVGSGARSESWLAEVLAGRDRSLAAATFSAAGLYFVGPYYDAAYAIPDRTAAMDWLP
jgi:tRNA pseudouridine38-40 synthase